MDGVPCHDQRIRKEPVDPGMMAINPAATPPAFATAAAASST